MTYIIFIIFIILIAFNLFTLYQWKQAINLSQETLDVWDESDKYFIDEIIRLAKENRELREKLNN